MLGSSKPTASARIAYNKRMISQQKFPDDFLWGASIASHQVEGGTVNQWSVWELAQAKELAATAEQRLGWLPDWEDIKQQAQDPENYVSGKGVDHYNRYPEDFDLLKKLQFNSFRFGVEWSRINPEEGIWDKEAIAHYHDYIDALRERGIEPILNIWHTTMPTWFTDKGGLEKKENLAYFDRFVRKIGEEYGGKLKYILTLNEPNVYAAFSYLMSEWPPQKSNPLTFAKVYWNLSQAHRRAYTILKAQNPGLHIGLAAQLGNVQAQRPHNVFDGMVTKFMRYFWNWWFLNRSRRYMDFIGINYYFTDYYKGMVFDRQDPTRMQGNEFKIPMIRRINPAVPLSDVGFYMEPEGLYPILVRTWARYKKPIIVTENGVSDRNDQYREWWIEQSVVAMQRAMSEGVDVRGYMHWSLLDNFEWKFGWWPKFGLIAVDRQNGMKRTVRPSAIWFARYLRELQGREPLARALGSEPSKVSNDSVGQGQLPESKPQSPEQSKPKASATPSPQPVPAISRISPDPPTPPIPPVVQRMRAFKKYER